MKVIQIDLALRLQLVQEIKKTKGEGSTGAMPGGRKPTYAKKLSPTIAGSSLRAGGTEAVDHPNCVDARGVEEREVRRLGGKGALIVDALVELIGGT